MQTSRSSEIRHRIHYAVELSRPSTPSRTEKKSDLGTQPLFLVPSVVVERRKRSVQDADEAETVSACAQQKMEKRTSSTERIVVEAVHGLQRCVL